MCPYLRIHTLTYIKPVQDVRVGFEKRQLFFLVLDHLSRTFFS